MKRTKIMLTAIAVFAIAGGALAFKATKFGGQNYCYTTNLAPTATCPLISLQRTFVPPDETERYKYTTTTNTNLCGQVPTTRCTSIGRIGGQ